MLQSWTYFSKELSEFEKREQALSPLEGQIGLEFGGIRVYTYSDPFYSAECGLHQYNLEYFFV